ncbi:hypothetical protein [Microbispora sp. H10670]|uniref:hypothetical protein n=1 Tax=Microbispora sp. H10670 TaxID=2729108 RepID=UPI0015FFC7DC|nr:hypothetical protein [Microbispora sp. H10670]
MTTTRLAVLAMCALALLSACTERRPPPPVNDEVKKRDAALVAVVQCLVDHDRIPAAHLEHQPWLKGEKVQPSAELVTWRSDHEETVYEGRTLQAWEDEATAAWPGWRCPF